MKGERDGRKNVDWEGVRGERKGGRERETSGECERERIVQLNHAPPTKREPLVLHTRNKGWKRTKQRG